jgi:tetratricopeptide (TPR) repeat protein
LTPYARRSYPAYLLADEVSWLAIERGKEANLALSMEEEQILKSVSRAAPGQGSLPLFINGRAGSGKSTMLLYLFADYCYRKYYDKQGRRREQPLPGEPLFLTYNERLLEVARGGVNTLLDSHHRFLAERRSQGDERPSIDRCFQPFQKFLFSLLPSHERDRFDLEKYISFHRFKQLYQGKSPSESLAKIALHLPEARHYSPEMCWHVIRSFIKGYSLEECITPEDYQKEVPRKERTISIDKFQGIYYTIWERWYQRITKEQGYWDDQDLIATVLKLKYYRPDYTAIFCDEAQDFTRLELQLIMRLSVFSQYHLGYQPIHSLPFAFAGDPFQTLNPTGFHWSSIQAAFDSEVITALDPAEQLKLVINFQELAFNYRSCPPIVQFTNLIQLWRHVLFNIHELHPQTAWQRGNFLEPQKFILEVNINTEELKAYIKDTIIIVPCEEGEEAAYAKADEVLSEIFPQLESTEAGEQESTEDEMLSSFPNPKSTPPSPPLPRGGQNPKSPEPLKNVLSAISAKGLEFKKVILYKFGEVCNRNVWSLRDQGTDQKVKSEYFFNKLYVAASRATERLFVVDSKRGDSQLWEYASDEALLQSMLQFARNKQRWQESVRTISPGTPKTVRELREDEPYAIAQEFETKGLNSQNPGLLRRARQFYSDIGDTFKANFCEAWALKFEGQLMLAGCRFLQLGESEQAWECFWEGMCWSELVAWYNLHPERETAERFIANFMVAEPQNVEALNNFTAFVSSQLSVVSGNSDKQRTTDNEQLTNSKQWQKAVEEYTKRIEALLNVPDLKPDEWQRFGEVLEAVESAGTGSNQLAGECFYHAENYEQAVRIWEACGAIQTPEYNRAKAMVLGMPEGLEYLAQAGEHESIIAEWEKAGKPRDRNWLKYVAPALETKHQYQQAFVVYVWLDELVKVKECFYLASQGAPPIKLLTVLLQYFYRKNYFSDAIEAVENYLPTISGSESQKLGLKFDVVYEIACSELKPEDVNKEQRQRYEKFIKEQVLSTADWHQHLLMQQVGIALEKLGVLVENLGFYEQFVSHSDSKLRQFARERWIATKKKQEEYARNQGQIDKAEKRHSELLKKARSWEISPQSVPLAPPLAPKERPRLQIDKDTISRVSNTPVEPSKSPTVSKSEIQGLPSGVKVEQLEDGVVRFKIRHLVIRVMRQSKQVLILDALNSREVRVDGAQCKLTIGEATVEALGSNQLSFALSTSGYSGGLICDSKSPRLELNIEGLPNKISIDL